MHNYIYILKRLYAAAVIVFGMLAAVGCINDRLSDADSDFEIRLEITTRGEEDDHGHDASHEGEDPYNENKIDRIKLFFYPADADDDTAAAYSMDINKVDASRSVSLRLDVSVREKINLIKENDRARVFAVVNLPAGLSISENASIREIKNTTVTTDFRVRNNEVMPEFVMISESRADKKDYITVRGRKEADGTIHVIRTAAKIRIAMSFNLDDDGTIEDYDPSDENNTLRRWRPRTDLMRVYITNGVGKAHLGGGLFGREELSEDDYYKISPSAGTSEDSDYEFRARYVDESSDIEDFPYWHKVPLYSYPHAWENTPYEERQTYLVIQVPWVPVDDSQQVYKTFYYQVPVNLRGGTADDASGDEWEIDGNTLESNMYYLVKLNIGMLGSFNPEDPLKVEANYYVVPWVDEEIEAVLKNNRYLVVDENYWTMNNITDQNIPFYSSHETVVARVKFRFWNFNPVRGTYYDDGETFSINNYRGEPLRRTITWFNPDVNIPNINQTAENRVYDLSADSNSGVPIWTTSIDNTNFIVSYHHDMIRWEEYVNENTKRFVANSYGISGYTGVDNNPDKQNTSGTNLLKRTNPEEVNWSIITAEITIIHKDLLEDGLLDNTRFQQTITITQYPSQYIEADYNSGKERTSGDSTNSEIGGNENVFINKHQGNDNDSKAWYNTFNMSQSMNYNPNMYVITITQLGPEDSYYTIGDPRILTVNNNLSNSSLGGTDVDTTDDLEQGYQWSSNYKDDRSNPNVQWGHSTGRHSVLSDESSWDYLYSNNTFSIEPYYGSAQWDVEKPEQAYDTKGVYRRLNNYYPTEETDSKANVIAPKLRIASSYGSVRSNLHRAGARRRCAAYQEAGRPAGRWRLPTLAEIKYISRLSAKGRIPQLFSPNPSRIRTGPNDDNPRTFTAQYRDRFNGVWRTETRVDASYSYYWCAQGLAYIDGYDGIDFTPKSETTGEVFILSDGERNPVGDRLDKDHFVQAAVRCVYDEWYWLKEDGSQDILDEKDWNTFRWGDESKQNPQE